MENNLIVYGRNPVMEVLEDAVSSGKNIDTLYIQNNCNNDNKTPDTYPRGFSKHIALAKKAGAVVKGVNPEKLSSLCNGGRSGGIAVSISPIEYTPIDEMILSPAPFLLILDSIEDPHNLGALIRTAEAAGVDGVIIPKRRGVQITPSVYSASAGAVAHIKISRVTNLVDTINTLKKNGIWVYGAEADGTEYTGIAFKKNEGVALVIGSEGRGLSHLVRESCDFVISIPMQGKINSLNASVSGGILMFYIASSRLSKSESDNPRLLEGGV